MNDIPFLYGELNKKVTPIEQSFVNRDDLVDFPEIGAVNKLYLSKRDRTLYYWDSNFSQYSPVENVAGEDYILTEADKEEIADIVLDELPDFPDCISTPETAEIGQTIVVSEVDATGKPTAWTPANLPNANIPRIETSEANATIEPNKFYVFPEMANLSITLGGVVDNTIVQEYHFRFTSGATATTLTLPDTVKGDITVNLNSVVEISIIDGYAALQSWAVSE